MSSRALGALVRGIGEENIEDLLPWLMETLTSENSSVDRSGAAQGLCRVVSIIKLVYKLRPTNKIFKVEFNQFCHVDASLASRKFF